MTIFDAQQLYQHINIHYYTIKQLEQFMQDQGFATTYHAIHIPALLSYLISLTVILVCINYIYPINLGSCVDHCLLSFYTALTRRIHLPKHRTPLKFTPSISFMGGGHLWMFAIGAGHYIYEHFDIDHIKFLASSSGCFAAVPLACGLDPYAWCHRDWAKCMAHFDSRKILGCLCDSKYFYYHLWDDYLPADAHIRCSGRLFISVTLFPSMRNKVVSHFETREELLWVIVASMCLPVAFIRDFPVYCGEKLGWCFDGGFSNDSPCLDSYTITVSALHREADIKPAMDVLSAADNSDPTNKHNSNKHKNKSDNMTDNSESNSTSNISEYDRSIRIRAIDVMRTPKFSRVWQVGGIGERAAANCVDFNRHEWTTVRRSRRRSLSDADAAQRQLPPTTSTATCTSSSTDGNHAFSYNNNNINNNHISSSSNTVYTSSNNSRFTSPSKRGSRSTNYLSAYAAMVAGGEDHPTHYHQQQQFSSYSAGIRTRSASKKLNEKVCA